MTRRRPYHGKTRGKSEGGERPPARLSVAPELAKVFKGIGVPEECKFEPDAFQRESLRLIPDHDVLVSAPTGAGKTWIASEAMRSFLKSGRRVWYASPLKALSNSLYQEFGSLFGPENCGILTGDRKENAGAPVIVGTTEILRNQLYDAMHRGTSLNSDLVVMDEAHYLADPDRGVVWEEVLIYLPVRVRILLLSATVSNADEIARWLASIRGSAPRVVFSPERPVPLETLFLSPEGRLMPFTGKKGLYPAVRKYLGGAGRKRRGDAPDFGLILSHLRKCNLLPAIFFLKSRLDCDRALAACPPISGRRRQLIAEISRFTETYPHLRDNRQIKSLVESRVGSHHGGQLPYWKVLVERLMSRGFLEAIFSTSTVAAGVNFPARTVVLLNSDRFNGREFADLTATEFHQMTGRAGRRGKDKVGFALIVPGPYQDLKVIQSLMKTSPEPVLSQIRINFSMTLNLLLSHTPDEVRDLLDRSFAAHQHSSAASDLTERWEKLLESIRSITPEARCDSSDPCEMADFIRERSELSSRLRALERRRSAGRGRPALAELSPGTIVRHGNGKIYLICRVSGSGGPAAYEACRVGGANEKKVKAVRLVRLNPSRIKAVFNERCEIPEGLSVKRLVPLVEAIDQAKLTQVDSESVGENGPEAGRLDGLIRAQPCQECPHLGICHGSGSTRQGSIIGELFRILALMEGTKAGLWFSFRRHLRFLRDTGFATQAGSLTPDGYWASNLRVDQPLLIAEVIRRNCLDGVSPAGVASALAPFVWDRGVDVAGIRGEGSLEAEALFHRVAGSAEQLRDLQSIRGFDSPALVLWPAVAVYMWASGCSWERLVASVRADEGDLASLMTRTADHLRQVAGLSETHPEMAAHAAEAVRLIFREPVYID